MEASRAAVPALRPAKQRSLLRLRPSADRAFEQLYKKHAREVYQYALALLTNPADAEDVTQTTFMNAYRALQRGDRPHRPHNWLIAITHNVCRMRWRQAGHRPREVALDDAPEPVAPDRHDQPNLDDVLRALSRLSFNQRSALVMRELEGRSCKDIAQVLGLSVSAVEALLFRARRRLQIERKALGVLGTAPLPGGLASALGIGGGGGGAVASGLAALGSDAVLKVGTALVVAGATASGAVALSRAPAVSHPATPPPATHVQQGHHKAVAPARATKHHRAHSTRHARVATAQTAATMAGDSSGGTGSTQQQSRIAPPAPPAVKLPQVPKLPVQIPPVQVPALPVQLPPLPPIPPLPPLNP